MSYRNVKVQNQSLLKDIPETYLTGDAAVSDTTLTVENITGFAINQPLLLGFLASEGSEIAATHASTAPTGSTVTLASGLAHAHTAGDIVYALDYDQVEFSHAATVGGSKTVLTTVTIDPTSEATVYRDSAHTDGYYFTRFKNSITGIFSDYSDPEPFSGWAPNQVGYAIEYALARNQVGYSETLTHDLLLQEADACLQYMNGKLKKWHTLQVFDAIADTTERGVHTYALPSDAWQFSNKSILNVRIAGSEKLTYIDKNAYNAKLENVVHTTLANDALIGATSMTVANAYDLPDEGTVMVNGILIDYTAKDTGTGVLSGIPASGDGSITENLATGDHVWQGSWQQGQPQYFTVVDGTFRVWPLPDATWSQRNVITDYWLDAPSVNSDADTLGSNRFDAVKHWLTWVVRAQAKNNGKRDLKDTDYIQFLQILNDAVMMELKTQGQIYKWKPRVNKMLG